jgi:hypothetical protein
MKPFSTILTPEKTQSGKFLVENVNKMQIIFYRGHNMPTMEWNRRIAFEKEMSRDAVDSFRFFEPTYDSTGNFLLYATPICINV